MQLRAGAVVIVLILTLLAAPLAADAQKAARVPTIGFVPVYLPGCKLAPTAEGFLEGLRDLGYVLGRDVIVESRCHATDDEVRKVLGEFVRTKVDVIVVAPPAHARAAKNATTEIPIVCASCGDPVSYGLVTSLARPGGKLTGLASQSPELVGKRLELLKELVPGTSRVAVILYPHNPGTPLTLSALDAASRTLGIAMQPIEVRVTARVPTIVAAHLSTAAAGCRRSFLGPSFRPPTRQLFVRSRAAAGHLRARQRPIV